MSTKSSTSAYAIIGALSLSLLGASAAGAADSLTITGWGGDYQASQNKAYFEPFAEKTGIKIVQDEYTGEIAKIHSMVANGNTTWDVIDVNGKIAIQGCNEGILEVLDYSRLGGRDKFVPGTALDCGVPSVISTTIVAYDGDQLKDGPAAVADFFDTAKFPGKRGLWKIPKTTLEIALLADGVPASEMYTVLRTEAGVDRAFAKLDTIKNDIVWYTALAQPQQLLASGEVLMTTAQNGRIFNARKSGRNFEMLWDGQIQTWTLWAIPKGVKDLDASYAFLAFAVSPERQADQAKFIPYGPAHVDALALIDESIRANLPTAPQNAANYLVSDEAFWAEYGEVLYARFSRWLAQ